MAPRPASQETADAIPQALSVSRIPVPICSIEIRGRIGDLAFGLWIEWDKPGRPWDDDEG
jgi:hypothetical protein